MLIACKSKVDVDNLKKQLAKEFEMKDLGEAKNILGMEIRRDKQACKVWLSQKAYLQKVLQKFGIDGKSKTVSTPLGPQFQLSSKQCPQNDEDRHYMSTVP